MFRSLNRKVTSRPWDLYSKLPRSTRRLPRGGPHFSPCRLWLRLIFRRRSASFRFEPRSQLLAIIDNAGAQLAEARAIASHPGLFQPARGHADKSRSGLRIQRLLCRACWLPLRHPTVRPKSLILMVPLPRLERGTPRSTIWYRRRTHPDSYGQNLRQSQRITTRYHCLVRQCRYVVC